MVEEARKSRGQNRLQEECRITEEINPGKRIGSLFSTGLSPPTQIRGKRGSLRSSSLLHSQQQRFPLMVLLATVVLLIFFEEALYGYEHAQKRTASSSHCP